MPEYVYVSHFINRIYLALFIAILFAVKAYFRWLQVLCVHINNIKLLLDLDKFRHRKYLTTNIHKLIQAILDI